MSLEGSAELFWRYRALGPEMAPTNTPQVLLVVCGVRVVDIPDAITTSAVSRGERKSEELRRLSQELGYCWSVAVGALPEVGRGRMERWLRSSDPDVRWIMRENLRKKRLARLDPEWVRRGLEVLGTT